MNANNTILLVEDDVVDALTVDRVLKEVGTQSKLVHVKNGEEAISYLSNPQNQRPSFILLDINMPIMNGIEFLKERSNKNFKHIPVIVLTTSKNDDDVRDCYKSCISGYMVKPVCYKHTVEMMQAILQYWQLSETLPAYGGK